MRWLPRARNRRRGRGGMSVGRLVVVCAPTCTCAVRKVVRAKSTCRSNSNLSNHPGTRTVRLCRLGRCRLPFRGLTSVRQERGDVGSRFERLGIVRTGRLLRNSRFPARGAHPGLRKVSPTQRTTACKPLTQTQGLGRETRVYGGWAAGEDRPAG